MRLYKNCLRELTDMKTEYICTNLSLHDLLMKNSNAALTATIRNKNVAKALNSRVYAEKFPLYGGLLKNILKKAQARIDLSDAAAKTLYYLLTRMSHKEIPDLIIEEVLYNLSCYDFYILKNFINGVHLPEDDVQWL